MGLPRYGILLFFLWCILIVLLSWFSYAFLDGNLTLFQWPAYVSWQLARWQELRQPQLLAQQYFFLIVLWWTLFLASLSWIRTQSSPLISQFTLAIIGATAVGLLFGHNTHSRDIYNYLFNAKMVTTYHADPHVKTALDFANDPWVRFMHNTHTPAPYGYGWTAWSLIPYAFSGLGNSFLLSYVAMRLWMYLGWVCLLLAVWFGLRTLKISQSEWWWRLSLVALHPLILMETLLNGHNDVWMMAPAILAWGLVISHRKKWHWLAVFALLIFSACMKFATLLVWPLFGVLFLSEVLRYPQKLFGFSVGSLIKSIKTWGADLAMIAMLVPLFSDRSQQFHPWYATWFLAWLPFGRSRFFRWTLLGLSFTSQLRYLPWIDAGVTYTPEVQWQMRAITWSGALLGLMAYSIWKFILNRK